MNLDASFLKELKETILMTTQVESFHLTSDLEYYVVPSPDGPKVESFERTPYPREHVLDSLQGFIGFLNVPGRTGLVMVRPSGIVADLAYGTHQAFKVKLSMDKAVEFTALEPLSKGVSPKQLHKLLVTRLIGCLSPELISYISTINLNAKANTSIKVDNYNMVEKQQTATVDVTVGDGKIALPVDWVYTGRIYRCTEQTYEIPLRLTLETDGEVLCLSFEPIRIDRIFDKAHDDLVGVLKTSLDASRYEVYVGQF